MQRLCEDVHNAPITDSAPEHAVIDFLYAKQKHLLSRAYEAAYVCELFKETQSRSPRLDASMFVYDKGITLESVVCELFINTAQHHFVDASFVDDIIANNYQPLNSITAAIRQIMEEDDVQSSPLATKEYFEQNFLTARTPRIVSCWSAQAETPEPNRLLGYEDLAKRYIRSDSIIDLSRANIIGSGVSCTKTSLHVPSIRFKQVKVKGVYTANSNILINMGKLITQYVTYTNPYLADGATMSRALEENTNTRTVARLREMFVQAKAKKVWSTNGVRKIGGDVSSVLVDGVLHATSVESQEAVTYREFMAALNIIVEAVAQAAKGCDT